MSDRAPATAIVLAPDWPAGDNGYGIALASSLEAYQRVFDSVIYIAITSRPRPAGIEAATGVEWVHVPIRTLPQWARFGASLLTRHPATCFRYHQEEAAVLSVVLERLSAAEKAPYIIIEDIPLAAYAELIRARHPEVAIAIRSHDVMTKAYGPLKFTGGLLRRLSWRIEMSRIERTERTCFDTADAVWAITQVDSDTYATLLGGRTAGVVGAHIDTRRYATVPTVTSRTLVHVGSADLRKGIGLRRFVDESWPLVRAAVPDARFIVAGRNTETLTNESQGVSGLGYVSDDLLILAQGSVFINPQPFGSGLQLKSIVAMAAGRALVSTETGIEGIDGTDGVHFLKFSTPQDAATAVIKCLTIPALAHSIGKSGQSLAVARFSSSVVSADSAATIERLVSRGLRAHRNK